MNELTAFLQDYRLLGLTTGIITFLVIGLFHPLVIKGEYYFGTKCWIWFLIAGLISTAMSLLMTDVLLSTLFGVIGFSSFWSIKEVFEQEQRVARGWFPQNPRRKYPR
ncbi:MAG: DUF4491 family protein [Muribaculaceae bacterium]|nr:DUF4491 family protein [Muribaculaceae bacterium]